VKTVKKKKTRISTRLKTLKKINANLKRRRVYELETESKVDKVKV